VDETENDAQGQDALAGGVPTAAGLAEDGAAAGEPPAGDDEPRQPGPGEPPTAREGASEPATASTDMALAAHALEPTAVVSRAGGAGTDDLRDALDELRRVLDVDDTPPPTRRRPIGRFVLAGLLVAAVVAAALLVPWRDLLGGRTASSATGPSAPQVTVTVTVPGAAPATIAPLPGQSGAGALATSGPGVDAPGVDVTVAVAAGDTLDVLERVRLPGAGADTLTLSLPSLSGLAGDVSSARPSVTDLQVEAGGQVARALPQDGGWVVSWPQGGRIDEAMIRYRVSGAVLRSIPSEDGRATLVVTPLTGNTALRDGLPIQVRGLGAKVLGVDCPAAPAADRICGTIHSDSAWTAALPITSSVAVVTLQVDLPAPIG
jgi:hypothetical protein